MMGISFLLKKGKTLFFKHSKEECVECICLETEIKINKKEGQIFSFKFDGLMKSPIHPLYYKVPK